MSRRGRDDDATCCYGRLQSPETGSSVWRFLSSARYSDGKRSTNIISFAGKDDTTSYTNLFTPVLHTLFTFNLTLLSVKEEESEEGREHS